MRGNYSLVKQFTKKCMYIAYILCQQFFFFNVEASFKYESVTKKEN